MINILLTLLFSEVLAQYNQTIARTVAALGAITHCPENDIFNWNCSLCKEFPMQDVRLVQFPILNIMGFLAVWPSEKLIFSIFRGTQVNSRINWFQDLNYQTTNYPLCQGCKVHLGFYTDYSWLSTVHYSLLYQKLQAYPDYKVVFGGRSMGAAFSTLATAEFPLQFSNFKDRLSAHYNMGSPRVGNFQFSQFVNKLGISFRLVHYKDLVPHLPPVLPFNYQHIGRQVFYDEDMKTYRICDRGEDPSCSAGVTGNSVSDHLTYFYFGSCQPAPQKTANEIN